MMRLELRAGRQLDALVAKQVMGLTGCTFHEIGSISGMMTMWACEHADSSHCFPTNREALNHTHAPLQHYSTDIAAAWQVVEHMKTRNNDEQQRQFYRWGREFGELFLWEYTASEAAYGICIAALRAVGYAG